MLFQPASRPGRRDPRPPGRRGRRACPGLPGQELAPVEGAGAASRPEDGQSRPVRFRRDLVVVGLGKPLPPAGPGVAGLLPPARLVLEEDLGGHRKDVFVAKALQQGAQEVRVDFHVVVEQHHHVSRGRAHPGVVAPGEPPVPVQRHHLDPGIAGLQERQRCRRGCRCPPPGSRGRPHPGGRPPPRWAETPPAGASAVPVEDDQAGPEAGRQAGCGRLAAEQAEGEGRGSRPGRAPGPPGGRRGPSAAKAPSLGQKPGCRGLRGGLPTMDQAPGRRMRSPRYSPKASLQCLRSSIPSSSS